MAIAHTWLHGALISGKKIERLGTVEAPETFNVPIERQNRLFVAKLSRDEGAG
jgi:hypothetical protein